MDKLFSHAVQSKVFQDRNCFIPVFSFFLKRHMHQCLLGLMKFNKRSDYSGQVSQASAGNWGQNYRVDHTTTEHCGESDVCVSKG